MNAPLPPDSFYAALAILFGLALVWVIVYFITKTMSTQERLTEAIIELKNITKMHEILHDGHEEDIKEIKRHIYSKR